MSVWDSLINYGVPLGIIVWLAFIFYVKFKQVFDTMFRIIGGWIGGAFGAVSGRTKDKVEEGYEMVYTYGNR